MSNPPDILQRILRRKAEEVGERSACAPIHLLRAQIASAPPPRDFTHALRAKIAEGKAAVITEIKKASPSMGVLRETNKPTTNTAKNTRHGAACLSVLTDADFFQGSERYQQQARAACELPALRKDFIVDPERGD